MDRGTIRYPIGVCVATLAAAVIYAIVKLFFLAQRVDASILVVNVIAFAVIAGFLMYLMKKDRDLEKEELFKD